MARPRGKFRASFREESFTIRSMDGVTRNLFQREDHWKGKELARISLRASERLLENNDSNVVTRSLPALRIQLDEMNFRCTGYPRWFYAAFFLPSFNAN